MTNVLAAAYLATNVLLTAHDLTLTNCSPRFARELYTVRNACVVEREINCPVCRNVSTQQVDITDVYEHYERMRASDLRIGRSVAAFSIRENNDRLNDIARLEREIRRLRDTSADAVRKVGRDMYVGGYTNALMVVVRALRKPADTCVLCRTYTSQETRLMRKLAAVFETAARAAGGADDADGRN